MGTKHYFLVCEASLRAGGHVPGVPNGQWSWDCGRYPICLSNVGPFFAGKNFANIFWSAGRSGVKWPPRATKIGYSTLDRPLLHSMDPNVWPNMAQYGPIWPNNSPIDCHQCPIDCCPLPTAQPDRLMPSYARYSRSTIPNARSNHWGIAGGRSTVARSK